MGKIAAMLPDNASDGELLEYLKWAKVENMGLGPASRFDRSRLLKVIAALRAIGAPHDLAAGCPVRAQAKIALLDYVATRIDRHVDPQAEGADQPGV